MVLHIIEGTKIRFDIPKDFTSPIKQEGPTQQVNNLTISALSNEALTKREIVQDMSLILGELAEKSHALVQKNSIQARNEVKTIKKINQKRKK